MEFSEHVNDSYQTLKKYRWVARRYDQVLRRTNLSYSHHELVASREDRGEWLKKAEENHWSVRTMLEEMHASDRAEVTQALLAAGMGAAPLPQVVANVEKLVQDGAPISHAIQTVIGQYYKPIEPEDVTERSDGRDGPEHPMEVVEQQEEKQVPDDAPISCASQTVIDQYGKPIIPGHEDKVWKFRNAVLSLAELATESKDTLALIMEDAGYLPHGAVTQDHITKAFHLLSKVILCSLTGFRGQERAL
jgi:hypothetical protein